jgi:hypothetical protein
MIQLISPDGKRQRLRWTDKHPLSRYGLGVVLRAKSNTLIDGATFDALARDGWRIECSDNLDCRRVAGALAWSALGLPAEALAVRHDDWL